MGEHPPRQLDARRHQESRPVHGVEPDDVLADHVQVGGPVALEHRGVGVREADTGQVVGQGVDPDVHDVLGMVGNRHAPVERGARDRQVPQAPRDEADHLVAPDVGSDEVGVGLVVREQPVGVFRQLEEVGLFLGPGDRGAGLDRVAHAVVADLRLVLGEEALVAHRVPALVGAEIDVAGVVHAAPDGLRRLVVVGVAGPDEPVERDVEPLLHLLEDVGVTPRQLGGGQPLRRGGFRHLQAVHIRAGEETHVETVESLEARQRVGRDLLVGMPDVRRPVGIVDRRGDVEGLTHLRFTLRCGSELSEKEW